MQYSFRNAKFSKELTPSLWIFLKVKVKICKLHSLLVHLNNKSGLHTLEYRGLNNEEHSKNIQKY